MFFNYYDRQKALDAINQWILDGSRIESWGNGYDYEWINLRGKDGALEEFTIYDNEESFRAAVNDQVDNY